MTDKSGAWAGNILWVIGFTMQSGADTSFLYDTLKEGGREHEYKSIDGKSVGLRFLLVAFCSLITGALASIDPRLPLYLCIPFVLIPLVSSLFIHEPIHTSEYSVRKQLNVLKQGIVFIFKSKEVRFMVGLTTLLMCISKLWFFTYNPYFEIVGMEVSNFGFIFFLLNLVAWFSSHYAERIEAVLGEGRCILVMVMCIGVPILLMGLFPLQICAYLVLSQSLVRGFLRPFTGDYMHRHIKTEIRATAMSVKTSVASIASIASLFLFGLLIEKIGLLHSLVILGVTCLTLGIYAYDVFKNKIK
jgi:hypothetical protein